MRRVDMSRVDRIRKSPAANQHAAKQGPGGRSFSSYWEGDFDGGYDDRLFVM